MAPPDPSLVSSILGALTRRRFDLPPGALMILAALSVQIGASVATFQFATYGPVTIVALRLAFGAAMVLAVRPPRIRSVSGSAWRSAIALGADRRARER
jgi:inner membrane transporter RhtA